MTEKAGMSEEMIINRLKEHGFRITKQRKWILRFILGHECSCCKEIYYQAGRMGSAIGMATVYRMVKMLEEAGLIHRKNMYRIDYESLSAGA